MRITFAGLMLTIFAVIVAVVLALAAVGVAALIVAGRYG